MIVVGFDGSPDAEAAVRWAAGQAQLESAVLDIVHAYDFPYLELLDETTRTVLHDRAAAIADAGANVARVAQPGIEVRTSVRVGSPAEALLDAAAGASLLVVGHRGEHRTHHVILGSIASKCLHRAACPVVVLRHDPPAMQPR